MKLSARIGIGLKALSQLGATQVGLYGLYQLGLRSGHYQRQLSAALSRLNSINGDAHFKLQPFLTLPERTSMSDLLGDQIERLIEQADEVVDGKVRLFGGKPVPLSLSVPKPLKEWTVYEGGNSLVDGQDIKLTWEPGRFGWACTLAMAYHMRGDERYAETFWLKTEQFLTSNPPFRGPHWCSAQEAAIRLVALSFAIQTFVQSKLSTPERLESLARAIAMHAERIPPTLVYARSQNNNHLITEALGLYTASALLPEHPLAPKWHELGWKWLEYAFRMQIDPDGTYTQHSTNYHRLMLQAALWAMTVHDTVYSQQPIPAEITTRLEAATNWLWKLVDPESGSVANLGHNDGAYILPLSVCEYQDYRPVVNAAVSRFLHTNLTPRGAWDDMSQWIGSPSNPTQKEVALNSWRKAPSPEAPGFKTKNNLYNSKNGSWATIRAAKFHARPAHADQLHLDLWWRGLNIAQDAGTFLYNASPPWDNSLMSAFVHNTVTVDGREFMLRAGRFLYLDWAQAEVNEGLVEPGDRQVNLLAEHDGYRSIGVRHHRQVSTLENGQWRVTDRLEGSPGSLHTARLHWLLPDWKHELISRPEGTDHPGYEMRILSPFGWITLRAGTTPASDNRHPIESHTVQVVRAGVLLEGTGMVSPICGWTSPTYGDKIPALAFILEISQSLPIELKSEWTIPNET